MILVYLVSKYIKIPQNHSYQERLTPGFRLVCFVVCWDPKGSRIALVGRYHLRVNFLLDAWEFSFLMVSLMRLIRSQIFCWIFRLSSHGSFMHSSREGNSLPFCCFPYSHFVPKMFVSSPRLFVFFSEFRVIDYRRVTLLSVVFFKAGNS